jgi:hypothetical protein
MKKSQTLTLLNNLSLNNVQSSTQTDIQQWDKQMSFNVTFFAPGWIS